MKRRYWLALIVAALIGSYIGWVTAPITWTGTGYCNTQTQYCWGGGF